VLTVEGKNNGGLMQNYEIRILKSNNGPITYAEPAWSDEAAVQDAKRLAKEQDGVEVWRDNVCLFFRNCKPALPW
jgi:hypothetical protein